jgi:hypothetical protein
VKSEKKRADDLFSLAIVASTGKCENSPCRSNQRGVLTPAHILNRWHDRVRCDTRNAFCLCFDCHRWFEDHPLEFNEFVAESHLAIYLPTLIAKSNVTLCQKTDWGERIEFLTDIVVGLKTLKQARLEEV